MSKRKKASRRKQKLNPRLKSLFKMSREQLALRKMTGGGIHNTHKDVPRSRQKRLAVDDHLNS